jgi:hypothetical protein
MLAVRRMPVVHHMYWIYMQVVGVHHMGNQLVGPQQGRGNPVGVVHRVGHSRHIAHHILSRRFGHMVEHTDHSTCYGKKNIMF